jgi:hypothetical protein
MSALCQKRTFGVSAKATLSFANSERNIAMSDFSAFAELERRSWSDATRASSYVELFAAAPDQAIDHLLEVAGAALISRCSIYAVGRAMSPRRW